jgi:hypothetical protein
MKIDRRSDEKPTVANWEPGYGSGMAAIGRLADGPVPFDRSASGSGEAARPFAPPSGHCIVSLSPVE